MTGSEDRWVYPADGEDPRDADRKPTSEVSAERGVARPVRHDQDVERDQGLTADKPGVDPSDREREIGDPGAS